MIEEMESYGYAFTESEKEAYSAHGGVPWFDGSYTIFGQVFDGLDIIYDIEGQEVDEDQKPKKDVVIEKMTVEKYDGGEIRWDLSDYK